MKLTKILSSVSLAAMAFGMIAGCENGKSGGKNGQIVQPLSESTVIMKFNGGTITAKDVQDIVKPKLKSMEEEGLEAYKRSAERALLTRLLTDEAKKQGVASPEALMQKIAAEATVSDEQVKEFFKTNNLAQGIPDPKTGKKRKVSMDELKGYLSEQERQQRQQAFLQSLMAQAGASTVLEEPRTNIAANDKSPFKGGANAKVVVYEFSDFECPFCARGRTVVDQINKAYGDKVKIVFRHFPLDFHKNAMPAAIASMCANREGKFWAMHDKFFDNQRALGEDINKMAKEVGVDMAKFEACVKGSETAKEIQDDMKVAETIGVNSTPTFFVNGKRVAGALPFEQFKSLIDAELGKN